MILKELSYPFSFLLNLINFIESASVLYIKIPFMFNIHWFYDLCVKWLSGIWCRITHIAGYILAAIFGILVDVPVFTLISLYKAPILLIKGWQRLLHDLIGREGPFLETVCVPFAGLLIVLWPLIVLLATSVGILSSLGFGFYAAVVAYQVLQGVSKDFKRNALRVRLMSCFFFFLLSCIVIVIRKIQQREGFFMHLLLYPYLMSTPMICFTCEKALASPGMCLCLLILIIIVSLYWNCKLVIYVFLYCIHILLSWMVYFLSEPCNSLVLLGSQTKRSWPSRLHFYTSSCKHIAWKTWDLCRWTIGNPIWENRDSASYCGKIKKKLFSQQHTSKHIETPPLAPQIRGFRTDGILFSRYLSIP